jgi:hypothetical protein
MTGPVPSSPEVGKKAADFIEQYLTSLLRDFPVPTAEEIAAVNGDEDAPEVAQAVNVLLGVTLAGVKAGLDDYRRSLMAEQN